MAVDLEENIMKAVTQNAEIMVRLSSIEKALVESAIRGERRDEQLQKLITKVELMDDRLTRNIVDSKATSARVDDMEDKLDRLITAIETHSRVCHEHIEEHCTGDECGNGARIGNLETTSGKLVVMVDELVEKVRLLSENHQLNEVRELITTKYGLQWLRFMVSRYGMWWMIAMSLSAAVIFFTQYGVLKAIYDTIKG